MKDGFMTPPNHENFEAKRLFGAVGDIIDGSIAYITLKGGRPHSVWSNTDDETVMIGISVK